MTSICHLPVQEYQPPVSTICSSARRAHRRFDRSPQYVFLHVIGAPFNSNYLEGNDITVSSSMYFVGARRSSSIINGAFKHGVVRYPIGEYE